MAVFKGSTSGGLSQGSFMGPFSERKHPLLMEDVLDTLFPYLPFNDIKSCRLVCKSWNEIGIKFLGRRKIKPIKFSDLTLEDLVYLRREFASGSHQKIKLFQGLQLNWRELIVVEYHNFLSLFKPSQLIISGGFLPTLSNFCEPLFGVLTDLSLSVTWSTISQGDFWVLNDLTNPGIILKRLKLKIYKSDEDENLGLGDIFRIPFKYANTICLILQQILIQQSPTLEELHLELKSKVPKDEGLTNIQCPVFPRLHSLTLAIGFFTGWARDRKENHVLFEPFNFSEKFPKLTTFDVFDSILYIMDKDSGPLDLTKGHPLKKLVISSNVCEFDEYDHCDVKAFFKKIYLSFPFIEEFISDKCLEEDGSEIPWTQSLRILEFPGDILQIDLLHLKKLEHLDFEDYVSGHQDTDGVTEIIERLKNHYIQLPCLKSIKIYRGFTPENIDRIKRALPIEFLNILTIK